MKKIVFGIIFVIVLSGLFLYREKLVGSYLEPRLENTLTKLFGMPVVMETLRADPFSGRVTASYIEFHNQPEFTDDAHLRAYGLSFQIDFLALLDRKVLISQVDFYEPYYFIDRIAEGEKAITNITAWLRSIRGRKKKPKDPNEPPKPKWLVKIDRINLHNGIFFMHDRSKERERKFKVSEIEGYLAHFQWPTDPDQLSQSVEVRGLYGVEYPAPAHVKGIANFATKQVSFDLVGEIPEGDLKEYDILFEEMPISLVKGSFKLNSHTVCLKRALSSENVLVLKNLDVKSETDFGGRIWGGSVVATISFIEDQKEITLNVPVEGKLSDPEFGFQKAFREAFRHALRKNVISGLESIRRGTARLVQGAQTLGRKAPSKVADGLGTIGEKVVATVPETVNQVKTQSQKIAASNDDALTEEVSDEPTP